MGKFVAILVALAIIQTSQALKCKRCQDACDKLEDQTCPAPPSDSEAACLTHIYKMTDGDKKEMTEKKCVNKKKGTDYQCIPTVNTEEIKCVTCSEDLCNTGNSAGVSCLAAVALAMALLVPTFA